MMVGICRGTIDWVDSLGMFGFCGKWLCAAFMVGLGSGTMVAEGSGQCNKGIAGDDCTEQERA